MRARSILPLLLLTAALPALAQDKPKAPADKSREKLEKEAADATVTPPADETQSVTAHSLTLNGKTLKYHATAGTLTIRDNEAKPTASMFYVAYTLDGAAPGSRPVTFVYNGGPGSPTVWLHMGSFGPVRVKTDNPLRDQATTYGFGPNPDSLLDKTDLVFIDMVGAGYSRPLGAAKGKDFWGVDEDVDAFAKAILRWTTKNDRWTSPKVIFGESYGTLRSGALAYQLEDRGLALDGVILLSSIMNYGVRQPGYDALYTSLLPSFAATAWYHNRIPNRPAAIEPFVAEVRAFTDGAYAAALAKGHDIDPAELDRVAAQMAGYIGLPVDVIKRSNLRITLNQFRRQLLRDQNRTIGRLDGRYTGIMDEASDIPNYDPSSTAVGGAYMASFNSYIRRGLGYRTELSYNQSASELGGFDWNWKHRPQGEGRPLTTPNTALDLAGAMRINPGLKVLSLNGWYDLATPFHGLEYDVSHMFLEPAQKANVSYRYYPAGHMIYLNPETMAPMKRDIAAWYDSLRRR